MKRFDLLYELHSVLIPHTQLLHGKYFCGQIGSQGYWWDASRNVLTNPKRVVTRARTASSDHTSLSSVVQHWILDIQMFWIEATTVRAKMRQMLDNWSRHSMTSCIPGQMMNIKSPFTTFVTKGSQSTALRNGHSNVSIVARNFVKDVTTFVRP